MPKNINLTTVMAIAFVGAVAGAVAVKLLEKAEGAVWPGGGEPVYVFGGDTTVSALSWVSSEPSGEDLEPFVFGQ